MRWRTSQSECTQHTGAASQSAPSMPLKDDILRAYTVLFWFNLYLRYPEFPASDGLFPKDPSVRRVFLRVHDKVFAHWATAANRVGISTHEFRDACAAVRASWIGEDDPLRTCRGRASVLSDWPQLDLD
jgi:hypothetical protein